MVYGLAIFVFVLICFLLIGIILLQSSKTGGMGTAMGGNAMNTAFGGQGADKLLVRITSGLAFLFMFLAIIIGMMDNPASRLEVNSEPTLKRNTSNSTINNSPSDQLLPLDNVKPIKEAKETAKKETSSN